MSTKNLARTVLEAGRMSSGTWGRREDNARLRNAVRTRLASLRDEDEMDDLSLPVFKKRNRHLDDKLGPPRRWLASQIGRPWDLVRSELFRRFDTRTTAGRHIVFDHMLHWVETGPRRSYLCGCRPDFRVDRHGILRRSIDTPH